ncbi:histidine-type phosphatase (plasmid) [Escherichia albertii]|uniref:histidine-type phosphatase n=1 Tax=Escherichia albertii TaxID=208962 RepID=UPI001ABF600D|nr:histidine-type phosphatase [Escherichia albertii]QST30892.1 histidine-type phosphatase [Escherichia albertii]QST40205.1 histidine-type phosphatase [Escherichia albertii]
MAEVFMGAYFKEWFIRTGLVEKNSSADDSLFVYTNSMPRTIATGKFFMDGAFPYSRVNIHTCEDNIKHDPLFYQTVKDKSVSFVVNNTRSIHNFIQNRKLEFAYKKLEDILDYKNSPECRGRKDKKLRFNDEKNIVSLEYGKEPSITGPLYKSFLMVDTFILQNYEGFLYKDIAWGKIHNDTEWKILSSLRNTYLEATYLQPEVARNIITPLVSRIRELFPLTMTCNDKKINVIVGHDTTIGPLLSALGVNDYELPGQFERIPVGGKVVFQRWTDKKNRKDFLKTEYIYQTTAQIRNLVPLSTHIPPNHVTLSFKDCPVDDNGFCPFEDFCTLIKRLTT